LTLEKVARRIGQVLHRIPYHYFMRLLGLGMLGGVIYLLATRGVRLGYFSAPTIAFGIPTGIGLILHRRWGRVLGLLFFGAWFTLGLILVTFGPGTTNSGWSLLLGAVASGLSVYYWED
jgi:hypothetical protein